MGLRADTGNTLFDILFCIIDSTITEINGSDISFPLTTQRYVVFHKNSKSAYQTIIRFFGLPVMSSQPSSVIMVTSSMRTPNFPGR